MSTTELQIGKTLEERRTALKLTLDEVADKTRIRREYLSALEADDFAKLPGAAYITGFLRSYADFLGLNANQLVTEYLSLRSSLNTTTTPAPSVNQPVPRRGIHLFVIVLSSLLLAGYWFFSPQQKNAPEIQPSVAQPDSSTPTQMTPQPPPAEKILPTPTIEQPPTPLNLSFAHRAHLQLEAIGPTHVSLTIDDRPEQRYAVTEGTLLRWKISDTAKIHIADPEQVILHLNKERVAQQDNHDFVLSRTTN